MVNLLFLFLVLGGIGDGDDAVQEEVIQQQEEPGRERSRVMEL